MKPLQKGILWAAGCVLLVFGLSLTLARLSFGYVDLNTVRPMILMLLPLLGAAAVAVVWLGHAPRRRATEQSPLRQAQPRPQVARDQVEHKRVAS